MMPPRSILTLCLIALALDAASASSAHAQSVTVVRIEPGAEAIASALESTLAQVATVQPDPGFYEEARRRGLDPSSARALDVLIPLLDVDLVLVPKGADQNTLWLEYRRGRSGQPAGEIEVPLTNASLNPRGTQVVLQQTQQRLRRARGGPRAGGQGTPSEQGYGPGHGQNAVGGGDYPTPDGYAPGAADTAGEGEDGDEDAQETGISLELSAALGVGSRVVEWPTITGSALVDMGPSPTVELVLEPRLALDESLLLGVRFAYTTTIGAEVEEPHDSGTTETIGIRAHRFEGTFGPEFRFGDGGAVRLAVGVGAGVKNLRPTVHHLNTPAYSLFGPKMRVAARIAVTEAFFISLVPEAQLVTDVGDALNDLDVEDSGLGVGGEGALGLVLSDEITMQLSYYESHAILDSELGGSATDVSRTGALRLMGTL